MWPFWRLLDIVACTCEICCGGNQGTAFPLQWYFILGIVHPQIQKSLITSLKTFFCVTRKDISKNVVNQTTLAFYCVSQNPGFTIWGSIDDDRRFSFGWTIPFRAGWCGDSYSNLLGVKPQREYFGILTWHFVYNIRRTSCAPHILWQRHLRVKSYKQCSCVSNAYTYDFYSGFKKLMITIKCIYFCALVGPYPIIAACSYIFTWYIFKIYMHTKFAF